ncbi:MAG: hypothetical protein HYR56_10760 [Acidobacteria bacterium]|nr:hypothetical protein [Acidobacteriota bacterium]MBI3424935.1 hypothetical protein [Acidobacteriota bacterium]
MTGEPGLVAIQSRLEAAAAKTGRVFEVQTLIAPARKAQPAATRVSVVSRPALTVQSNPGTRSDVAMLSRAQTAVSSTTEANTFERKKRPAKAQSPAPEKMSEPTKETITEKGTAAKSKKAAPKTPRPKQPGNGTIYLLLSKNGKYKELRESELLNQAAMLLNNPALRLVKGQLLVPTISFQLSAEPAE